MSSPEPDTAVQACAEALAAALATVSGLRVYTDPGATVDPPTGGAAAVLGPPALTWEGPGPEPTTARFLVYVVVAVSDRAVQRLWVWVPRVAAAIDTQLLDDAVVRAANPGSWGTPPATELPAYLIEVEMEVGQR